MKSKYGFSIIEIGIVFLVISAITIGIVGGNSLVKTGKITALIREINGYSRAAILFYSKHNRLPGDLKGSGKIGYGSDQTYTTSSFPAPYNGTDPNYPIPNAISAPFIDLYLTNIIKFRPKGSYNGDDENLMRSNGIIPTSEIFGEVLIKFQYLYTDPNSANYRYKIEEGNYINAKLLDKEISEKVDKKLDDSIYNSGTIRGQCGSGNTSYSASSTGCGIFIYII